MNHQVKERSRSRKQGTKLRRGILYRAPTHRQLQSRFQKEMGRSENPDEYAAKGSAWFAESRVASNTAKKNAGGSMERCWIHVIRCRWEQGDGSDMGMLLNAISNKAEPESSDRTSADSDRPTGKARNYGMQSLARPVPKLLRGPKKRSLITLFSRLLSDFIDELGGKYVSIFLL